MNTPHTPLDLMTIRQHILHEFGVVSWALKTRTINTHNNQSYSRLDGLESDLLNKKLPQKKPNKTLESKTNTIQENAKPIAVNNLTAKKLESNKSTNLLVENKINTNVGIDDNISPIKELANQNNTEPNLPEQFIGIQARLDRFELLAISYRDWVILADNFLMTANEKNIWHSLSKALCQTNNNNDSAFTLKLHYPMVDNDYPEYENFHQGSYALLGFLLRLCHQKNNLKIALLTPLSDGIYLGNLERYCQNVPVLSQMVQFNTAKKLLWEILHQ